MPVFMPIIKGGGGENKLPQVVDKTVTEITASDLSGVESISDYAFYKCASLESVEIPDSVKAIGAYAFNECSKLANAPIPNGMESIGNYAFFECSSLPSIEIPDSVTSLGQYAFGGCAAAVSLVIGNGMTALPAFAFIGCYGVKSITLPDGLVSIGEEALNGISPRGNGIAIPATVTSIGRYAFRSAQIGNLYLTDLAAWCNLTLRDASSHPHNAYGGNYYINGELVNDLVIPDGVTKISNYGFFKSTTLKSIKFPSSVTSIGTRAFFACGENNGKAPIFDFRESTAVPTLSNTDAFPTYTNNAKKIVVPDALYDTWIAATNWASISSYIYKASEVTI